MSGAFCFIEVKRRRGEEVRWGDGEMGRWEDGEY
jgi:hypothetical protein